MLVAFPGLILALFVAVGSVSAPPGRWSPSASPAPRPSPGSRTRSRRQWPGPTTSPPLASLGVGRSRLLTRHVLPNIAEPLVLNVTTAIGTALLAFSALSFLGLGVQPPYYDWGRMLNEGLGRIYINPAGALAPGAAIVFAGLTFNLLGEGLAQVASGRHDVVAPSVADAASPCRPPRRPPTMPATSCSTSAACRVSFPPPAATSMPSATSPSSVRRGEIVGIVGESGSGKTVTALAIAQLVSFPGVVTVERYRFDGRDVIDLPRRERRRLLATSLPMVFQNPGTSLNPALRVGRQLAEVSEVHGAMSRTAATQRAVDKLRQRRHRRPGTSAARLSARALRRHEAAGRDRHGPDGQAQAVHRRRADDRPRRHRAAPDLRPAPPGEPRRRRLGATHLPRRRRRCRVLRPRSS